MSDGIKPEILSPELPRKLYIVLGSSMGMHIPQTMVSLNALELENYRKFNTVVLEIGDAHPDLAEGIEWSVTGIRRKDLADLPDHPCKKRGAHAAHPGIQSNSGTGGGFSATGGQTGRFSSHGHGAGPESGPADTSSGS